MNYESALEYIHAVQWAGHKPGLTRTRTLLAALGDPHKQLRFIHVAGTNGKGSTACTPRRSSTASMSGSRSTASRSRTRNWCGWWSG